MKNLFLLLACAFVFASTAFAQKTAQRAADTFQLGSRTVRIPAPEGFTEIFSRFDRIAARLIATEDPGNEVLTSHLPRSVIPQIEANQDRDLEFYTKVSVSKRAKTSDQTPAMFTELKTSVEKEIDALTDPNSPLLRRAEGNAGKNLTELLGSETTVKFNQPVNLGVFDNGEKVISSMMLMNIQLNDKKFSVLGTTSFVNINHRLVFIYTYKMNPAKEDIEMLRNFAKKWTAAIIAANKAR